jgi:hypothetical protein
MEVKMKKYSIQVSYETGDSFSSRDEVSTIELTWNKLEVAKANLKRIEEHYRWYAEINSTYRRFSKKELENKEPNWHKTIKERWDTSPIVVLKTDDGKDFQFYAFWCGYFETLYSAEIVLSENSVRVTF